MGSGNVFADLGIPNPEQELLKAELTLQIYRIIKQRNLTQTQAGKILSISQPHVSALARAGGEPFRVFSTHEISQSDNFSAMRQRGKSALGFPGPDSSSLLEGRVANPGVCFFPDKILQH